MYTACHTLALHAALPIYPRPGQQQPGDRQPLTLAAGQPVAALADHGVETVGQGVEQVPQPGPAHCLDDLGVVRRSEEHTSELPSLMRISYAVFCLTKTKSDTMHDSIELSGMSDDT